MSILAPSARAAVVPSGDVDPADPNTWTASATAYVGKTGGGTLQISGGDAVTSGWDVVIGHESASTGEVTVDGAGSELGIAYDLYVGNSGAGTLNITGGGVVYNGWDGFVGCEPGSTGGVTVSGTDSAWEVDQDLYVGRCGDGTLNIAGGGTVSNAYCAYVADDAGTTGTVTVDGSDSTWLIGEELYVGYDGNATLNITGGAEVWTEWDTCVAYGPASSGAIHFDNGTLNTGGLLCGINDIDGTGTINTNGLVSDIDLVFDATHGLTKTLAVNGNPGQDITVNLDVDGWGSMGAGFAGAGTMTVADGSVVESAYGCIGVKSGSTGVVTVDGAGSTWMNTEGLIVGDYGDGTLNITDGGAVVSLYDDCIAYEPNSTGVVTVDGPDSTWVVAGDLFVGYDGSGTLEITDGAFVTVDGTLTVDSDCNGDSFIDMGPGSTLAVLDNMPKPADFSIHAFLTLINAPYSIFTGPSAVRYWDDSISDWAFVTSATRDVDYTLTHMTEGDLAGYTVLVVPEPATVCLLLAGGTLGLAGRRRGMRR